MALASHLIGHDMTARLRSQRKTCRQLLACGVGVLVIELRRGAQRSCLNEAAVVALRAALLGAQLPGNCSLRALLAHAQICLHPMHGARVTSA
jgi:hypothetical protein